LAEHRDCTPRLQEGPDSAHVLPLPLSPTPSITRIPKIVFRIRRTLRYIIIALRARRYPPTPRARARRVAFCANASMRIYRKASDETGPNEINIHDSCLQFGSYLTAYCHTRHMAVADSSQGQRRSHWSLAVAPSRMPLPPWPRRQPTRRRAAGASTHTASERARRCEPACDKSKGVGVWQSRREPRAGTAAGPRAILRGAGTRAMCTSWRCMPFSFPWLSSDMMPPKPPSLHPPANSPPTKIAGTLVRPVILPSSARSA
jgi:hypothetical protein